MIHNESFPIGLAIRPTERVDLFDSFVTHYEETYGERRSFSEKELLSDEGGALLAIGDHFLRHYKCDGHLLQKFGSRNHLALFARKLVFSPSE
jgi:hypothetical protein